MPLRHRIRFLVASAASAVLLASAAPLSAQRMLGPGPNAGRQSVYVRDSAIAAEKLALAERMERLKEWNKSADVYQEIIEKYPDRVVPSGSADAAGNATRYTSVLLEVQKRLGKWPDDALQVYRARYESPAATLLETAASDDAAALSKVVQLYFPTDAAKTAALRLMELYLENGEFSASAWLGERLLANHPGIGADAPKLLFRTALAQHMAGNAAGAKGRLEELKQRHADATGTVRGQDVVLADELAKLIAQPAPVARGAASDSWPTLGGDASRGRVPVADGRPGAKVADIPLARTRARGVADPGTRGRIDALEKMHRERGLGLGIIPVVDRGEMFYQDNSRVYAVNVESGLALPGWAITYGPEGKARFSAAAAASLPSAVQMTVTATDASVLAVLGQPDRSMIIPADFGGFPQTAGNTQLVCLDRATGAKRWSAAPAQFPEQQAALRTLSLSGSPLVVGDNVYVAARGGKNMQFDDAYVLCFGLGDGKLRWACYLASGSGQGENLGGGPMPTSSADAVSHLAYSGGRVYAGTNLGAVAAIDAYAGTIAWLSLYPKPPDANILAMQQAQMGMAPQAGGGSRKPWAHNPVVARDGKIFALPSDAAHVLVYDAATGEEIRRIALEPFDGADTLVGVVDDKLVVVGRSRVFCVNWPAYDPKKPANDNLHWKGVVSVGGTEGLNEDTVRGRAFMTADSVFVPTRAQLKRISMKDGRVIETYPKGGTWPTGEGPGNVLVTQDQVVIAGVDSILVYSDLALARAKLDRAIEAAPADPLPRLKYAETLFAAGAMDAAVEKLDQAIQLLGGMQAMRPGPERDRVFDRALTFAERSADPKAGVTDPARAAALYNRAAAAAASPPQHVTWRFSLARFARGQRDFTTEVRLYQEILASPLYRSVSVPSEDATTSGAGGFTQAGAVAEAGIAARLRDYPAAYRPFEQAAQQALAAARQGTDPQQMLAVAQTYPNAKVAPEAMLAAAEAYEAAGKHRPAAQVLNQVYRKYKDASDRARIIEAQARNYLALPGGIGVAIGRLNEGAKLQGPGGIPQLTRPLKLPDGSTLENVSFGAAVELLQKYSASLASASLPDFNLPQWTKENRQPFLPENPASIIHEVDALVLPPVELRAYGRNDRVVTYTAGKGVSIYAVGSTDPTGVASVITQEPLGCAWLGSDLLIWTADRVALLRGDGAELAWQTQVRSLPPADAASGAGVEVARDDAGAADGVGQAVIVGPGNVIIDNQVVQLGRGGRRFIRAGGAIQIVVQPQPPMGGLVGGPQPAAPGGAGDGEAVHHVRPVADRVVVATSAGRIAALELSNGQLAWQARVAEAPLAQLVASDDFIAARFAEPAGAQLVALDTFNGQVVMRRGFSQDGRAPLNLALSPDGTLLWTLPDRLCGKDLYDPGKHLRFGDQPLGENVFAGASEPDQLLVADGRVLAVADNGRFVRILSPDTGRDMAGAQPLSTGAENWNVRLRVLGPRLYVINQRTAKGYNLDRLEDSWPGTILAGRGDGPLPFIRDAFIGRRHVVLLDQPTVPGAAPAEVSPHFRLLAHARYARAPGKTGESGMLEHDPFVPNLPHPVGIHHRWQPVDGGFYYRSVDRKLHYLRGAATNAPAD